MAGSHLLLVPEMAATGYGPYPEVLALAERAGEGPIFKGLARTAAEAGIAIAAGFAESHPHGTGISHYIVFPTGQWLVQRKHAVTAFESPLVSVLDRSVDQTSPNQLDARQLDFPTFEVSGFRCALVICADFGITHLQDHLDALGVDVLLLPTGAGGDVKSRVRTEDFNTREGCERYAAELEKVFFPGKAGIADCLWHRRAMAAVNQMGWDGLKCAHLGHGSIISPLGEVKAFFHGIPNLDRQRPMLTSTVVSAAEFSAI